MASPWEEAVLVLESNVKELVARWKREGTVGCSFRNLMQCVSSRNVWLPNANAFERALREAVSRVKLRGFRVYD